MVWPEDAFFVRVVDVWLAGRGIEVCTMVDSRGRIVQVKRAPDFCNIVGPEQPVRFTHAASGGQATLSDFWPAGQGVLPAVAVPERIASLIGLRQWKALVFVGTLAWPRCVCRVARQAMVRAQSWQACQAGRDVGCHR